MDGVVGLLNEKSLTIIDKDSPLSDLRPVTLWNVFVGLEGVKYDVRFNQVNGTEETHNYYHTSAVVILIQKNSGHLYTKTFSSRFVTKGDLIVVPAGKMFYFISASDEEMSYMVIQVTNEE